MTPIVEAASGVMSGVVKPILDKFVMDADKRLEAEQFAAKQLQELNIAQLEVNQAEAANPNLFVSGWRPFVGWVCGASFAYAMIGNDILNCVLQITSQYTGKSVPKLPEPDTTLVLEILFALLGFGGLRTYEKLRGAAK